VASTNARVSTLLLALLLLLLSACKPFTDKDCKDYPASPVGNMSTLAL